MKVKNIEKFLKLNENVHIADSVFEQKELKLDCLEEFLESDSPVIAIQKYLLIPKIDLQKFDFTGNKSKLKNFYSNLLDYLELNDKIGSYSDDYGMNPNNYLFDNFLDNQYYDSGFDDHLTRIGYGQMFFDTVDLKIDLIAHINASDYKNSLLNKFQEKEFHERLKEDISKKTIEIDLKNRTEIYIVPYSLNEIEQDNALDKLKFPLQDCYKSRK